MNGKQNTCYHEIGKEFIVHDLVKYYKSYISMFNLIGLNTFQYPIYLLHIFNYYYY
jgi:hypothetical protein